MAHVTDAWLGWTFLLGLHSYMITMIFPRVSYSVLISAALPHTGDKKLHIVHLIVPMRLVFLDRGTAMEGGNEIINGGVLPTSALCSLPGIASLPMPRCFIASNFMSYHEALCGNLRGEDKSNHHIS